jgi:alpha-ketoglutarate-dependent taurine dioxygenase
MKTIDLPGFGSLGAQAVDINLNTASDNDLMELGKLVFDKLVVYVDAKCASTSAERFHYIQTLWGDPVVSNARPKLEERIKKEGMTKLIVETLSDIKKMRAGLDDLKGMIRVTGIKDEKGKRTGMFADGELEWHSNQQSDNSGYAPLIGLQGVQGTQGSSTEFLQTVDAFNDLSSDLQSEVRQLVAIHSFEKDKICKGTSDSQALITQMHLVPDDGVEMPVISTAPNGMTGMHFPWTSVVGFKGYTQTEFESLYNTLVKHLWQDKYVYKHMWQDGEIVWMDQIVTLHRRPGSDTSNRLLHRMCSDWSNIIEPLHY